MSAFSAKRGCSATASSPPCPYPSIGGSPATGWGSSLPSREAIRNRPARSVTSVRPSGRNASAQGCSSPWVSVTTRKVSRSLLTTSAACALSASAATIVAQAAIALKRTPPSWRLALAVSRVRLSGMRVRRARGVGADDHADDGEPEPDELGRPDRLRAEDFHADPGREPERNREECALRCGPPPVDSSRERYDARHERDLVRVLHHLVNRRLARERERHDRESEDHQHEAQREEELAVAHVRVQALQHVLSEERRRRERRAARGREDRGEQRAEEHHLREDRGPIQDERRQNLLERSE